MVVMAASKLTLSLLLPSNGCKNRGTSPSWVVARAFIHCGAFLPMIARIAIRDRDHDCLTRAKFCSCSRHVSLASHGVLATHRKRGGINMDLLGFDSKDLARSTGNTSKQLGGIVRVQPIQGASQAVIVEHLSTDPCSQQMLDGFVGEVLRHQIQLAIAETQAVEDHGDGGCANAYLLTVARVLSIQPGCQPNLLAYS